MFGRNINVGMTDSGGGTVRPPADTDKPKKTEQTLFKKTQKKLEEPATVEAPQSVAPTSPTTPTQTTEQPTLESLFSEMLARYMPETVSYTPLDQDAIREMLIEWLRPAYEQAIQSRREQTKRSNAELDADAWARGMGTSTYVTDVKDRAYQNEARDVDALEGNYAATLAGQLYDAMQKQQEQALQVEQFNAEPVSDVYEQFVRRHKEHGDQKNGSGTAQRNGFEQTDDGHDGIHADDRDPGDHQPDRKHDAGNAQGTVRRNGRLRKDVPRDRGQHRHERVPPADERLPDDEVKRGCRKSG